MDSHADCNAAVREIYSQQVRVIGHGAMNEQNPPTSCTLRLKSTANFEQTQLRLQVVSSRISDCQVQFTMYDGDPGSGTLVSVKVLSHEAVFFTDNVLSRGDTSLRKNSEFKRFGVQIFTFISEECLYHSSYRTGAQQKLEKLLKSESRHFKS